MFCSANTWLVKIWCNDSKNWKKMCKDQSAKVKALGQEAGIKKS